MKYISLISTHRPHKRRTMPQRRTGCVKFQGDNISRHLAMLASLFLLLYGGLHSRMQSVEHSFYVGNDLTRSWNANNIVEEIRRLGNPGISRAGKDFRSLICCISRNDICVNLWSATCWRVSAILSFTTTIRWKAASTTT